MSIVLDGTNGILSPDFEPSSSTTPTNGLFLPAANAVGFATNSSERVRIDSSGNVGIGTSSPSYKLDVSGAIRSAGTAGSIFNSFYSNGTTTASNYGAIANTGNTFIWGVDSSAGGAVAGGSAYASFVGSSAAYPLELLTSGAVRATLDISGNLGLGVTPSAWGAGYKALQVGPAASLVSETNANTRLYNNAYFDGSTVKYVNSAQASQYLQFQGQHLWLSAPSGTAGNAISFTQAMTLDASGNLLVGQTARGGQNLNSFDFDIQAAVIYQSHVSGVTSGSAYTTFHYASTQIGSITQNGTTGVLYNITSDQRLKDNIIPAGSAIQSILDFPVDQFDWIADGSHVEFGAVAQKAINVIPEMVSVPANEDEMWGIDWSKAVPRLIKTIQELTARLEALENKS